MKLRSIRLVGPLWLLLSPPALASDVDRLAGIDFTQDNKAAIQAMIGDPETCAGLLRRAVAGHAARKRVPGAEPVLEARVIGGCQAVSLDGSRQVQVVATADLDEGNGPMRYVAIYKRLGAFDVHEIALGEGSGALGAARLYLRDIDRDGRLELVDEEIVSIIGGRLIAMAEPAPTVTHIYVWRNDSFVVATREFRGYVASDILPDLRRRLSALRQGAVVSARREAEARAVGESIVFADRFLGSGHYFPQGSED